MLKPQWDKILKANAKAGETFSATPVKLFVNAGRHKGKIATVGLFDTAAAEMVFEDGKKAKISYVRLDMLDENGEPVRVGMIDMLGDEIEMGALVCYSTNSGGYGTSHALEIGRVQRIGATGTLMVKPLVRNSEKAAMNTRFNWQTRQSEEAPRKVDATRCLKIPVDVPRLMMSMMADFDNLGSDFNG